MSNFGSDYAAAYDAMYADKDYQSECDQLEWAYERFGEFPIESIVDIGCGTGMHSWELARRGYRLTGIDQSADMLSLARGKSADVNPVNVPTFKQGDAVNFDLNQEFDAAIMMFAVISYLSTNELLLEGLKNVSKHLKKGGLFLADFWYGPGVLMDNPTERSHKRALGQSLVERRVIPRMNFAENTCLLEYEVVTTNGDRTEQVTRENHTMRYLFGPELELAMSICGLQLLHLGQSTDWSNNLDKADWTASLVARRF